MMPELPTGVIAAVVAFAGAAATALVSRKPKNDRADYAARLVDSSMRLVEELQEELDKLRAEVAAWKRETIACEDRFRALTAYLRSVGLDMPDDVEEQ